MSAVQPGFEFKRADDHEKAWKKMVKQVASAAETAMGKFLLGVAIVLFGSAVTAMVKLYAEVSVISSVVQGIQATTKSQAEAVEQIRRDLYKPNIKTEL